MGQNVSIRHSVALGNILLVDTDRSLTGQDGQTITRADPGSGMPARLGERLLALDPAIDHIHVLQNTVTVRRDGSWDDEVTAPILTTMEEFLRFYLDR